MTFPHRRSSIWSDYVPHAYVTYLPSSQNQAAVNGIRASGATTQLILVEGTSYTGAWSELLPLTSF